MLNAKKTHIVLTVRGCFIPFDHFVNYANIGFLNYNLYHAIGERKHSFTGNDRPPKIHGDKRCPL